MTTNVIDSAARPLQLLLKKHHACVEGLEWASGYTSTAAAWDACQRSDWMLWALKKAGWQDDRLLRLFACWCVRHTPTPDGGTVWGLLDECSRTLVDVAERFARGEATSEELAAARDTARDTARNTARHTAWDIINGGARATTGATAWNAARFASLSARFASLYVRACWLAASSAQANALRGIVGNPFAVSSAGVMQ